ncbi:MAG TPA: universal stress protein [Candidatus Sulfomarinibacteraceae bacterium]|nr:universal stress protein [Candidatus Sulfomarinibacteraceae bacterium]
MIQKIVVPLDGSVLAETVLPHVTALARPHQARVTLLHVLEPRRRERSTSTDFLDWQMRKAEAHEYLEDVAARLTRSGVSAHCIVQEGSPARHIVDHAHNEAADLLILSSHGKSGLQLWNLSGVVQKVIQEARTSLLLVRAYEKRRSSRGEQVAGYRRIMVPLDGSARAEYALPYARSLAEYWQASLLLTHIVTPPVLFSRGPLSAQAIELIEACVEHNMKDAAGYLQEMQDHLAVASEARLRTADNIFDALENIVVEDEVDLIVCTAHGHGCLRKHPYGGFVTESILYGHVATLIIQDLPANQIMPSAATLAAKEHSADDGRRMPTGTMPKR